MTALLVVVAWLIAKASQVVEGDTAFSSALWDVTTDLIALFTPWTLGLLAAGVALYYAAVYPYYLYWLDRRVQAHARDGAQRFVASWDQHYQEVWGASLQAEIDQLENWWREVKKAAEALH